MRWAERVLGVERRNLEDPSTPVTAAEFNRYFKWGDGGTSTPVTESSATGLTAYLRAISLISSSMAMLPIRVYYRNTRQLVTMRTVLDNPHPDETPFEFWQTTFMQQLSWGSAFGFKRRNAAGIVTRIDRIHPSRVTVKRRPAGKVFTVAGEDGVTRDYDTYEVAHFPFLSPDGLTGLSPLRACVRVLGSALSAEVVTDEFFRNGTRLSGILSTDQKLTEPQAKDLKRSWKEKFAGPSRAGEIAILDAGASYSTVTLPPEDAQLLQTRSFTVSEIARMFGVPSHFLNDQEKATAWGSGIESMGLGYVIYTLLPRVREVEQRITRELLPGGWDSGSWDARIDLKGLLRGDAAARSAFYRAMTDLKVMTNHDVAELEDMDPPFGAPVYAMPSNYALVDARSGDVTPLTGAAATPPTVDATPDEGDDEEAADESQDEEGAAA